jgi:SAM-dependent methyltransferase
LLLDLAEGTGNLPLKYFSMVICCSVMEHVPRPWKMAENLTRLVRPGGKLYISVPWVWRYHKYPDDYFRFSFRAIMTLFPEFSFTNMFYSTTSIGEFVAIKESCLGIDNVLARIGKEKNIARKYLPCLMLHMLGTKAQAHQHAA